MMHILYAQLTKLNSLFLLIARICIGGVFIQSGWGKFMFLDRTVEFFTSLGIPAASIQAPFVAGVEVLCGSLILLGLFTRIACLPLVGTMIVAILTTQLNDLASWRDFFSISEFAYICILLLLASSGAGKISLDARISV